MQLPETLSKLKERANRFLYADTVAARRLNREVLKPLLEVGDVTIVGGALRDLAFYGAKERPISDIDIVIAGSPSMIERYAVSLGGKKNRFGGFGIKSEAYKVDFWALSSTWARREGHSKLSNTSDIVNSTFFDWDAVAWSLKKNKIYAIDGYLDKLKSRRLEINLRPNPSEEGNLVRALRRLVLWDAKPGPRLRSFIEAGLTRHQWSELLVAEKRAFNTQYLSEYCDQEMYISSVLNVNFFSNPGRDDRRELSFDFIYDCKDQYNISSEDMKPVGFIKHNPIYNGKAVEEEFDW